MKEERINNRPQKYSKISLKRRQKLVSLVINKSVSIFKAAKRLGIKNSTAKLIINRFKNSESYFESKKMKEIRIKREKEEADRKNEQNRTENEAPHSFVAQPLENMQLVSPYNNYYFFDPWSWFLMPADYSFVPLV